RTTDRSGQGASYPDSSRQGSARWAVPSRPQLCRRGAAQEGSPKRKRGNYLRHVQPCGPFVFRPPLPWHFGLPSTIPPHETTNRGEVRSRPHPVDEPDPSIIVAPSRHLRRGSGILRVGVDGRAGGGEAVFKVEEGELATVRTA